MALLEPYRLAQKLHRQLVSESAKLQAKILYITAAVAEFGDDALPQEELLQGFNNTLAKCKEGNSTALGRHRASLRDNLDTIRELEAMFERQDEADMEAFGAWIRNRYAKDKAKPNASATPIEAKP